MINEILNMNGYGLYVWSAFSFTLVNNKLRIFPDPTESSTMYFDYVEVSDRDNPLITEYSGSANVVSDFSNVPYDNMQYQFINDVGKQWIRKYGLALCKELLGIIRSKYGAIPIPGAETTLDGETLRSEATTEKETLVSRKAPSINWLTSGKPLR